MLSRVILRSWAARIVALVSLALVLGLLATQVVAYNVVPYPGEPVSVPQGPPGVTPPPPPTSPPTPTRPTGPVPRSHDDLKKNTEEESRRITEGVARHWATLEAQGQGPMVGPMKVGPESAGAEIWIAGQKVQLPPDAYIVTETGIIECVEWLSPIPWCPPSVSFIIRRGGSTITIQRVTGEVAQEYIAPGEAGALDFLNQVRTGEPSYTGPYIWDKWAQEN